MPEPTDQEKADPKDWEHQPWRVIRSHGGRWRVCTTRTTAYAVMFVNHEAVARHVVEVHNLWLEVQNTDVVGMTPKEKAVE